MAFNKTLIPCLTLILVFVSMTRFSEGREFGVGGNKSSWEVPSSPDHFNKWAERNRFQIGDSIVLKYDEKTDSVVQVIQQDFKTCNKSNPIKSYNDGNTRITLDKSGPFFFISGAQGHCEKGQKLELRVLSAKHGSHGPNPSAHQPSPSAPETSPSAPETSPAHHAPAPAPHHAGSTVLKVGFMGGFVAVGILVLV